MSASHEALAAFERWALQASTDQMPRELFAQIHRALEVASSQEERFKQQEERLKQHEAAWAMLFTALGDGAVYTHKEKGGTYRALNCKGKVELWGNMAGLREWRDGKLYVSMHSGEPFWRELEDWNANMVKK